MCLPCAIVKGIAIISSTYPILALKLTKSKKKLLLLIRLHNDKENPQPIVIGHRGAMGHETENTLASIQKALKLGVDMIEIDIFKISSGELVVFHDEEIDRLTSNTGKIQEQNLAQVKQLTLKGNHKIPVLEEVLDVIDKKIPLNIELKNDDSAEKLDMIIKYYIKEKAWTWDSFIISSFNQKELIKMRKLNTRVNIAILTEMPPLEALAIAEELNAVAINPYYETLTKENVAKIHQKSIKVYAWTVNQPGDIQKMKELGIDGIITDYPERITQCTT